MNPKWDSQMLCAWREACARQSPPAPVTGTAPAAATHMTTAAPDAAAEQIAWRQGDIDAAFKEAAASNKPVLLYWGAVWCPPCHQLKATVFNRRDFVEKTRLFVPVYLDGDDAGAQKSGEEFKV